MVLLGNNGSTTGADLQSVPSTNELNIRVRITNLELAGEGLYIKSVQEEFLHHALAW
jgi:hypothetical protein